MEQLQSLVLNPLKPIALPITTNLPAPVQDAAISLLGKTCHKALLLNLDITSHPECLSLAISKALGIAIITAASVVKVPQIIKLARSQSAEGLSISSYILETASFLINLAYNIRSGNPFSTYGEVSLILVQDVLICAMILFYSGKASQTGALMAALGGATYALLGNPDIVSQKQMTQLQAGAGVLSIASKLPQIFTVWAQGGTGQLSAFAVFNYLAGSLSRIFTTLQEVDDKLILYGFVAGFVLNAVLAAQMVYYWNSPATTKGSGQKGVGRATEEKVKMAGASASSPTSTGRATPSSGRRKA
jgi:mannose-P-dolichol utilization defect 1